MKVLNLSLMAISFSTIQVGLGIDVGYWLVAAGSSIAGSLLLGYFRPERTFWGQINKVLLATIGGVIFGSAFVHWRQIEAPPYLAVSFCCSSMAVLIFIRTWISMFEANAGRFTTTLIQRIFNIRLEDDDGKTIVHRPRGKRKSSHIHVETTAEGPPKVLIGEQAVPDEIKIIEQTVIEQKKEDK